MPLFLDAVRCFKAVTLKTGAHTPRMWMVKQRELLFCWGSLQRSVVRAEGHSVVFVTVIRATEQCL